MNIAPTLRSLIVYLLLVLSLPLSAQNLETASGFPFTPENLIETVFLGDGLEIISVNFEGDERQVGFFQGGNNAVGTSRGLMMSTGIVKGSFSQIDPENVGADFASTDLPNVVTDDPDLEIYQGPNGADLNDIVRYTIRFRPYGDSIRFRYVFASEEYPEFVCSGFNDIFGFFLSGPGITGPFTDNGKNIALVPGTNSPVRINTVNGGGVDPTPGCDQSNTAFYRDNNGSALQPVYDGLTTIFVAESEVIPCEIYTMTLVLADAGDGNLDSGVFLEAKSFEGNALDLDFANVSLDNAMAEGCRSATVTFNRAATATVDEAINFRVFGDATPGIDYTPLPDNISIPAGQNSVSFTIEAFEDNLAEGDEFIHIELVRSPCLTDTFTLRISDNIIRPPNLVDSLEVCPGDTVALDASLPIDFPPLKIFRSEDTVQVESQAAAYSSFIEVFDAVPEVLRDGVIRAVCIDSFVHQWIDDLDLYLIGPNGQIMELTTDNGGDGGNGFQEDAYIRTCFTPRAVDSIRGMGTNNAPPELVPFTGDWVPEAEFENLFNGVFTTNGTWELRIIDDSDGGIGTLYGWSIHLEPTYGVNYSWSPDTSLSCYDCPMPQYLGEDEGTFYLNATDSYGCAVTDSVFTRYRPGPTLDLPVCEGSTDSSITVSWNPIPEALSYQVRQTGRGWTDIGLATLQTFHGLFPDSTYSLYVRAIFADCPSAQANIFCRTAPCIPPNLRIDSQNISCFEENDGRITISAEGNRAPFTYTINGTENATGNLVNLVADTYRVVVRDTVGCQDSLDVVLTQPAALMTDITTEQVIRCTGTNDGILAAPTVGGTAPYTFQWNQLAGDSLLMEVAPGEYVVSVTDANGCTTQDLIVITGPTPLVVQTATTSSRNCIGEADGAINFVVTGGTPDYGYQWSDLAIGDVNNPDNLEAGDYAVTLTDANGCQIERGFTVIQEAPVILQGDQANINCFGEATGQITTSVDVGEQPFLFTWSGPNNPTGGASINNLTAGDYAVTITDDRGCMDSLRFTLTEPSEIVGNVNMTPVGCNDLSSGALDWSGAGGALPYAYSWSNGFTQEDISGLAAGDYTLELTDGNGCIFRDTYTVTTAPRPSVATFVTPATCHSFPDGGVIPAFTNATAPLDYVWVNEANGDTIRSINLNNVRGGTYQLIGRDANGCLLVTTVAVPEPAPLQVDPVIEDIRCAGEQNGLIELSVSGGSPTYQFRRNGEAWTANSTYIGLAAGTYSFEVRDQNNCLVSSEAIELTEPAPLTLDLGGDQTIPFGQSVQLFPGITGGAGVIDRYEWTPRDSTLLSCFDCPIPFVTAIGQTEVSLRITDARGCSVSDRLTLFVGKDFSFAVPTGFTPNGDGVNDRLIAHGQPDVTIRSFRVYDRWGELLFEEENFSVNDTSIGWDGNFKDEPLNAGVYLWQATVEYPDGQLERFSGEVTLLR
ncbi:MAG: choice-of-anchor L domain-containing protein [Bacteroidota bacterium]